MIGPDGAAWQTGEVEVVGATVSTAVRPLGPAGRYEIGYRVVSGDGDAVSGGIAFTVTAPGSGAGAGTAPAPRTPAPGITSTVAAQDGSAGAPVWPWIVGVVVLVAAGVTAALRLGRDGRESGVRDPKK